MLGHAVPNLVDASKSARAALAGFAVARAWRHAPRPSRPTTCSPSAPSPATRSRAQTLVDRIYRPLQAHSTDLLTTLWSYLDNGRSLEATARELFVHPNTVRYRLKRVSDVIGWDATGAREALILQTALILGSMSDHEHQPRRRPHCGADSALIAVRHAQGFRRDLVRDRHTPARSDHWQDWDE